MGLCAVLGRDICGERFAKEREKVQIKGAGCLLVRGLLVRQADHFFNGV
jgi:hypothetical protein